MNICKSKFTSITRSSAGDIACTVVYNYRYVQYMHAGVMKLLNHLKKHNIPMAIATGSDAHSYEMKTCRHGKVI